MRMYYTGAVGYLWLEITLATLRGLEPYEVLQALGSRRRYPVPGQSEQGVRVLTIWARTRAGRPLVVALRRVLASQWDWWIVGARDMDESELALFEQWETKAGDDHD
jgi:hypothetical protein